MALGAAAAAAAGLALLACEPPGNARDTARDTATASPPAPPVPLSPHEFWARVGVLFDPERTAPGDTVGELTVDTVAATVAYDSTRVGIARFRGEIRLSGRTMRNPDDDLATRAVCFEADSISAARLPRWRGDARRPWFCFTNERTAARTLAPPGEERAATVVIDRFTIHRGMSDEVNSARLVRVPLRGSP